MEAVQMVVNSSQHHFKTLSNITKVKDHLATDISYCPHVWIAGQRAMELITAHIEKKPVEEIATV
jgi:hypothetical protein